ncbi:MAG: ribosome-associated translation inhibitor RaiA [Candidatus Uhrbacteria bacterium]
MQIVNIKATNMELTDAIRDYAEKKVLSLKKYVKNFEPVKVSIEVADDSGRHKQGPHFKCEFTVEVPGDLLRVEKYHENLYAAIDQAKDELARQMRRLKGKLATKQRRGENLWKRVRRMVPGRRDDSENS